MSKWYDKPMTLDGWFEYQGITEDNIEQIIEDRRTHWQGCAWGNGSYQCKPKVLELNTCQSEEYAVYTWDEVREAFTNRGQLKFF